MEKILFLTSISGYPAIDIGWICNIRHNPSLYIEQLLNSKLSILSKTGMTTSTKRQRSTNQMNINKHKVSNHLQNSDYNRVAEL